MVQGITKLVMTSSASVKKKLNLWSLSLHTFHYMKDVNFFEKRVTLPKYAVGSPAADPGAHTQTVRERTYNMGLGPSKSHWVLELPD